MVDPRAESHVRLKEAVRRNRAFSREGLLERLFERLFRGLVYTQIWEDPEIDLEALALRPDSPVVAIASGGCNVLSYLTADPGAHHGRRSQPRPRGAQPAEAGRRHPAAVVARLSTASSARPTIRRNVAAYHRLIAPHLDPESRAYWEGRGLQHLGRRRISIFARNAYRHGVLGRFIGIAHAAARLYGVDPARHSVARVRWTSSGASSRPCWCRCSTSRRCAGRRRNRLSLYGLGIPPAQYEALAGGDATWARVLRSRVERLACGFSLDDNYFTWQAFGRRYAATRRGPLPPYLRREQFDAVRARVDRVEVLNRSVTEYLAGCPDASRRPLRPARRAGLDDRRPAQRAVGRDHPHRRGPARG